MAMFGRQRDVQLFNSVNQELIHDIIEQLVGYYKVVLTQTPSNVYGEQQNKTYSGPVLLPCLLVRGGTTSETDNFGPDTFRELEVRLWRDDCISANVVPEIGDIVLWNNLYYEVDNVNENQLIVGKDPSYPYSDDVVEFGDSLSFILTCHLQRPEISGIEQQRL
jgi:hypothetical protein